VNLSRFSAQADIVGRRVSISWDFELTGQESLANIPPVTLRRKSRDFAFPPTPPDPFLVFDSSAFPPAPVPGTLNVTDLPTWERRQDGERIVFEPVSVAAPMNGRMVEVLRRTTGTAYDAGGTPVRQRVEILDVGGRPGALQPNTVYYYQLFGLGLPADGPDAAPYRATAMVTDAYGLNRTLYQMLPEIYRRQDVTAPPAGSTSDSVPELSPSGGQLRRFIDLFGIALDSLRGTAEGLRTLHDLDRVDAKFLPLIAQWIGWDLTLDEEVPVKRNELKSASRFYRLVGTLPGLRALVSQYTGWFTQIAEFAQNIARANRPPQRNLFAITLGADGKSWHGVDDAAEVLGFAAPNQQASGSAAAAAALTGTVGEPFALRPGMSLTLVVDGLSPSSVRFGPDDFADITNARATEVVAAINQTLPEANATVVAGKLKIASRTVGVTSLLEVVPEPTSLISLENAPSGRLSAFTDSAGRLRLFYEAWETPTQPAPTLAGGGPSAVSAAETGNFVLRRVHYKTFLDRAWYDSHPMFPERVTPQGGPAALALPDDRIWIAWLDDPLTANSRLRWAVGTTRGPQPARLLGQNSEPFGLTAGAVLTLTGNWAGVARYTVKAADFADITQASAAEVVRAMNGQLTHTVAARQNDGSLRLATKTGGARATLAIDLKQSTTARVLGFDSRNAVGVPGSWSEVIDWSAPFDALSLWPGRHAEPTALNDPAGGVRLAWATHRAGLWRIATAHWNDRTLIATANGAFVRDGAGAWVALAGLPSPDVRAITVDANGTAWIGTGAGVVLRRPDGTIAPLAPPLPSADVRDMALAPDGSAWFATGAGIAIRAPGGTITSLTTAQGLPSDDVKAVLLCPDGTLWAATAAGAVRRRADGSLRVFDASTGLPGNTVQDIAFADGTAYLATTAGLAISAACGGFTTIDAKSGLAASDARAVAVAPDGTVWVATAGGVSQRSPAGAWTIIGIAQGLSSADARSLSIAPDGVVWAGTAAGISTVSTDGTVTNLDLLGGGVANPAGRAVHTGWSAPQELDGGSGGNREPSLAVDVNNRTWLVWSDRSNDGSDSWALHYRTYEPATLSWGPDTALTAPPAGGRAADRTPIARPQPGGMSVLFSSDRLGGSGLWSVDVSLAGAVAPLVVVSDQASSDLAPTPVTVGGAVWVLYRSDDNVSLAQLGSSPRGEGLLGSVRVPDNGAVRRHAGTVAADLGDLNRLRNRGLFGDLLCYTPNRPDGVGALTESELYTRGTVGFYVSRANQGAELTQLEVERLNGLLQRFIPINLRSLIIVVEAADVEFVYGEGTDPQDRFSDDYPFVSALGAMSDSAAAAVPGLIVLQSNRADNVSANPANLTTLRGRTYFPPLQ
jgi:phage tail-like protein